MEQKTASRGNPLTSEHAREIVETIDWSTVRECGYF
jgi:hypothetical protein